jgi:DNA anti-recombination protein RmuC
LGQFESHADVGSPKLAGSATYNAVSQAYSISAAGANMWAKRDEFYYAWKRLKGDFILQARVEFVGKGVEPHRKLGWIVRTTLEPDSPYADATVHGDGLTSLQYRRTKEAITEQVQAKLDQNIKEGFAQFEKVQQHLKAAEEQLREVGALGHSINDLNNLLKLPHLRGQFGEASLERLLSDFLPAHMFEMQCQVNGGGRVDAMITFPDRRLPIDAKFPREQVLAFFENSTEAQLEDARHEFVRVMKAEGKRIKAYIQPEYGTTEIALMYLPSETLYMEAVRNRDLADWLNQQHVFPVSPNTLLMTLQTIALVHKWYEVASRFEKSRQELAKAQKSFDHFQGQFENVGKSLGKAQEAFDKASTHLKTYRGRVSVLSGQEQLELDPPAADTLPLIDKASA